MTSQVKVSTKERVKEVLDGYCWEACERNKRYDAACPLRLRRYGWATCGGNVRPECWCCHKNDLLSQRIAEEVGK